MTPGAAALGPLDYICIDIYIFKNKTDVRASEKVSLSAVWLYNVYTHIYQGDIISLLKNKSESTTTTRFLKSLSIECKRLRECHAHSFFLTKFQEKQIKKER